MDIWMWLLIGFLTGLVVAAIISLLRGSSSKNDDESKNDTAAKLAKSEVKVTVLEDKLRLEEADNLAFQAKAETDYKDQLDTVEAEYRANLAIAESENLALTAALADTRLEMEKARTEFESENLALTAALDKTRLELEKAEFELEAKEKFFDSELEISTIVEDEEDGSLEELILVADGEEITQEPLDTQVEENFDFLESGLLASVIIAKSFDGENEEADALEAGIFPFEEEDSSDESERIEGISETKAVTAEETGQENIFQVEELAADEKANETLIFVEEADEDDYLASGERLIGAAAVGAVLDKAVDREPNNEPDESDEFIEFSTSAAAGDMFSENEELSSMESADLIAEPDEGMSEILPVDDIQDKFEEIQQADEPHLEPDTIEENTVVITAEEEGYESIIVEEDEAPAVIDEEFAENSQISPSAALGVGFAASVLAESDEDEAEGKEENPLEEADSSDRVEGFETETNKVPDANVKLIVEDIEEDVVAPIPEWPEDDSIWRGEYFNNMKLEGEPVLVREDAEVDFDWDYGSPAPEINVDGFSVRWTRKADLPPGLYRFTVISDDGARFWVNERLVISAWYDHTKMTFRREMELPGGPVNLRLEYYEKDMTAFVQCTWERIG